MMLVKLQSGLSVNPEHVVSVTRDYYDKMILVKTVLGDVHEVQLRYGESAYEAEDRITKLLSGGPA